MKRVLLVITGVAAILFAGAQSLSEIESTRVQLPNGWSLTPLGSSLPLGDLPLNMAVSRSGKYLAVTNNGQSVQSLQLINTRDQKILDNMIIPKSWYGLHFSKDEKTLYASGGNDNWILEYRINQGKLILQDSILLGKKWPNKISPAGIELDDCPHTVYVVTKENNMLYFIDLVTKKPADSLGLGAEGYACVLSPDRKKLYISCWGGDQVKVVDTKTRQIIQTIPVGDNPNELLLTRKGKYLFVANANDNSV